MQFRRQGTKVFIKLELKKLHIFILQYSFIQLLLIYRKTIHMYSGTDRLHRMRVKAIYVLIISIEILCNQLT